MSRPAVDILGQRFGKRTVLARSGSDKNGRSLWLCRCDCGREDIVYSNALIAGRANSCGGLCTDNLVTDAEIFEQFKSGRSVLDIRKNTGASIGYIYRVLQKFKDYYGLKYSTVKRNPASEQSKEISDLFKAGATVRNISTQLGISKQTVRNFLKMSGVTLKNNRQHSADREEIIKLFLSGVGVSEIARRYEVTKQAVNKRLRLIATGQQKDALLKTSGPTPAPPAQRSR